MEIFDRNGVFLGYDRAVRDEVRRFVRERGLDWCIAAMVHGSIGYHSYNSAKRLIESVLANKFYLCERTSACFNGDASREALSDFRNFEGLEQRNPEKVQRILELVKSMKGLGVVESWTLSAMYPTLNL